MTRNDIEELLTLRFEDSTPAQKKEIFQLLISGAPFEFLGGVLVATDPGEVLYPEYSKAEMAVRMKFTNYDLDRLLDLWDTWASEALLDENFPWREICSSNFWEVRSCKLAKVLRRYL